MKRRSDIAKLVSAARDVWRYSEAYQAVKKVAKDPHKSGWFVCQECKQSREVIKVDHIEPIGKQPETMKEFGAWLEKLFCSLSNLQPLCADCHKAKTKEERESGAYKRHKRVPEQ